MVDFSKFVKSEKAAKERDPVQYEKDRMADARRMYKDADRFADAKLMERYDRMQKAKSGAGADIDFEKDGKKSKGVSPPSGSDKEFAKQQAGRAESRTAEIKKGAEEYKSNPRYDTEQKLRNLQLRGGSGRAASFSPEGGTKPGQSPSLDNPIMQAKGGMTKAYAKGGSVSARADGCAQRGKTKGRIV